MLRLFFILICLSCSLNLGCSTFEHPLSPLEDAEIDQEAIGSWYASKGKDDEGKPTEMFLHIGLPPALSIKPKESGYANFNEVKGEMPDDELWVNNMMLMTITSIEKDQRIQSSNMLVFPTKLGNNHYANVPSFHGNQVITYKILKYQINGDELTTWLLPNDQAIGELIQAGELHAGEKKDYVADDTETLRQVFVEHDAELFPPEKSMTFRRIKLWKDE